MLCMHLGWGPGGFQEVEQAAGGCWEKILLLHHLSHSSFASTLGS